MKCLHQSAPYCTSLHNHLKKIREQGEKHSYEQPIQSPQFKTVTNETLWFH